MVKNAHKQLTIEERAAYENIIRLLAGNNSLLEKYGIKGIGISSGEFPQTLRVNIAPGTRTRRAIRKIVQQLSPTTKVSFKVVRGKIKKLAAKRTASPATAQKETLHQITKAILEGNPDHGMPSVIGHSISEFPEKITVYLAHKIGASSKKAIRQKVEQLSPKTEADFVNSGQFSAYHSIS